MSIITLRILSFVDRQWMQLWDYLITYSHDPSLLSFAVVAYLTHFRSTFLGIRGYTIPSPETSVLSQGTLEASTAEGGNNPTTNKAAAEVIAFLRHNNALDLNQFIRKTFELRSQCPARLIPLPGNPCEAQGIPGESQSIPTFVSPWASLAPARQRSKGEGTSDAEPKQGLPMYPLTRGTYPAFMRYPDSVVNHQLQVIGL